VVFLSATVSERTRARLLRWGLAGPGVFGEGVWVLAQSERNAERFRSLGVPSSRIAVTGDLKAEPPVKTASRDPAARPGVVFGSLRPGEEDLALALARRVGFDGGRALVVAPRHEEGLARGAAIVVGPHAEGIQESVDSLAREGALLSAPGVEAAAESVGSLLRDPEALRRMGQGAVRAASAASESARRSLEAIERFGLNP